MRRLGAPPGEEHGLAESLPAWRAFPEVQRRARGGCGAAAGSSRSSRTPTTTSSPPRRCSIGVPFDEVVVAQEIGSYKPAHRHWEEFFARTHAPRDGARARRRVALPRHRARERAGAAQHLDQPARRASHPASGRRASWPTCWRCRRRSTSSFPLPRERAPCAVPRLPYADRRRDRARTTSATPAAVSSPPVSCGCRVRWARPARRWPSRRTWRCPGPRRRSSPRRRSPTQIAATARELPQRPLVLGGCCCAHVGAVRELARRHGRIGVVWIDAHGDLNTPETSPSGNPWGMPLRMLIDAGDVAPADVDLVGARNLDPPEVAFLARAGDPAGAGEPPAGARLRGARLRRVAPGQLDVFMPEPGGPRRRSSRSCWRGIPAPSGRGSAGCVSPGERGELAAAAPRARALSSGVTGRRSARGLSSDMSEARIDVQVEQSDAPPADQSKKHPNTCPKCGSHYRDDELAAALVGLRPLRAPLPDARPGADRLVRRPGLVRRGGRGRPLGGPARLLRPAARTPSGWPRPS